VNVERRYASYVSYKVYSFSLLELRVILVLSIDLLPVSGHSWLAARYGSWPVECCSSSHQR